jgi:hypothetical protein
MINFINAVPFLASPPEPAFIASFHNCVPDAVIDCWVKQAPPAVPQPINFAEAMPDGTTMAIPRIASYDDLLSTHTEVRIMNPMGARCLQRFLLWNGPHEADAVYVGVPNDRRRNIDFMPRDLRQTCRRIAKSTGAIDLAVTFISGEYYIKINGDRYYPIDNMYA